MNAKCPPGEVLERLLANQLTESEERALEEHVADCRACQQRLEDLSDTDGTIPTPDAALSSASSSRQSPSRRFGVLARMANSSAPALLLAERVASKSRSAADSSWRKLGSSSLQSSGRFLRRQFWCWPLIAAALVAGAGWWVSRSVESAMREQRVEALETILDADVAALRGWMDHQRRTAKLIADDEQLQPFVEALLATGHDSPEARGKLLQSPAQSAIRSRLAKPLQSAGFTGFMLVSPSGVALAVDDDAPVGAALTGYRRDFFTGVNQGRVAVSTPFISPLLLPDGKGELRAGQPSMYAAAPVHDEAGRVIAALGLRIRPEDEFTRILHVARAGDSGETYAFDREGRLLSQSRFDDDLKQIGLLVDRPESRSILNVELRDPGVNLLAGDRPTTRRAERPLTHMAATAIEGIDGYDVDGYRDYRGVPVVGAWQWLEEDGFGVATEIDVDEAFAPVYILRRTFAVLMGLLIAAAVGICAAMLIIARQQRRLRRATLAAQQFGQYTLVKKIGSGGMGTVYEARHAFLRRPTAIKLLDPEFLSDASIARFEREVQLTSGLTHPNTVAIYDYGRTESGVFYYAMEHLDGIDLNTLVSRHGPLPEERVLFILRQVCSSLAEAHAAGLVHRDVKPANIFLTTRGGLCDFVKVLDFGLARPVLADRDSSLTATDTVAGTPLYLSPEAITRPDRIDARADVYAIGAVGYYLLAGTPVFSGESGADICLKHVREAPTPPSARSGRQVSPDLEATLLQCLAKTPEERPKDAGDLFNLLESCHLHGCWTSVHAAHWWAQVETATNLRVLPE